MTGLFEDLLNLGAAYVQHVGAVRQALALPEAQAVAALSTYVTGLSDASFLGFKMCVSGLAGSEADANARQSLQWIVANADALRSGQYKAAAIEAANPEGAAVDTVPDPIDPASPSEQVKSDASRRDQRARGRTTAAKSAAAEEAHRGRPRTAVPAHSEDRPHIAGSWRGRMTDGAGAQSDASFRFSENGNVLYGYSDQQGPREVELTHAGQRIQYVPRGGGVITIDFDEVLGSAAEAGYAARYSSEKSSGGILDQESLRIVFHCKLSENRLAVVYTSAGTKHTSRTDMMVGGERGYRAEGLLDRIEPS